MTHPRYILFALLAAGFVGCASLPDDRSLPSRVSLTAATLGSLEGRYAYTSRHGQGMLDSTGSAFGDLGRQAGLAARIDSATHVLVQVRDAEHIVVTAYAGGVPVAGRVLEGAINEAGFFEARGSSVDGPALPLLWILGFERVGLGTTPDGDLLIARSVDGVMFLLVMPVFVGGAKLSDVFQRQAP